jgi:hypothetical protein
MDLKLRAPNPELRTAFLRKGSFDEILLQLTQVGLPDPPVSLRKVLFWGEGAGEISSYVAGWMAGKGIDVIVLDGANRFNAYTVSSFARRTLIPPEKLLKSIRIARAFTCYQMATLIGERLISLVEAIHESPLQKRWVILLGPLTTFLDEDVPEREVRPLFERSLRKIEGMASGGVPFLLFQSSVFSENSPHPPSVSSRTDFRKGRMGGFRDSKRVYLTRRLFQFSNEAWRIDLDKEGPKMIASSFPLPAGERDRVRGDTITDTEHE